MKSLIVKYKCAIVALAASCFAGCSNSSDQPPPSLPPGEYMFALHSDGTEAGSNAVRWAIGRPLSSDFALPGKFMFLDEHGASVAFVSIPNLELDNVEARKIKFGTEADKLNAFVRAAGSARKPGIDPSAIRDAADAIRLGSCSNKAVFFIGDISSNSINLDKSSVRLSAYWLDCGSQSANARKIALAALDEAGFDVVLHQTDPPLFWESVLASVHTPPGVAGGSQNLANSPSKPHTAGEVTTTYQASTSTPDNRERILPAPAADAGMPTKSPTITRIGATSVKPPPRPSVPAQDNAAIASASPRPTASVPSIRAASSGSRATNAAEPYTRPAGQSFNSQSATTTPIALASQPDASPAPVHGSPAPLDFTPASDESVNPEMTASASSPTNEIELRAYLDKFNVDGKHVMDTLPRCFVGIKYTHASATDPISCTVNAAEKREFDFPGVAAGTTRLVSKVASHGSIEALECYGFDDPKTEENADRLLVTLMRRPDPHDEGAKVVEVIVRRGDQIIIRPMTVPDGVGVVFPLSRFLK